jgi:hypothetical protein
LQILEWIGLTGEGATAKAGNNRFINFMSAIVALLGLTGTIIGITVDWEPFSTLIRPLLKTLGI